MLKTSLLPSARKKKKRISLPMPNHRKGLQWADEKQRLQSFKTAFWNGVRCLEIHVFQRCLCSHGTIVAAYFPQQAYLYSTASIWQLLYIPGAWLHQQVTQSYRSSWAYLFQPTKFCYWHILCSKPVCSHDATFQLDGYRWCFINVWTWPCRQRMQQNNVLIIDFRKIIA